MFGTKIRIDKGLMEKVKRYYQIAGYVSPDEFVEHIIEKEISKLEACEDDEVLRQQLKGLGYIS